MIRKFVKAFFKTDRLLFAVEYIPGSDPVEYTAPYLHIQALLFVDPAEGLPRGCVRRNTTRYTDVRPVFC